MSSSSSSSNYILSTLSDELMAIVGALIGGAKYGIKIRLPHALIMTLLFRNDLSPNQKLRNITKLVLEHASNLAIFATIYKSILASLKWSSRYLQQHSQAKQKSLGRMFLKLIIDGPIAAQNDLSTNKSSNPIAGHPERPYHALIAGATGGYFVWGRYSSVNHQIVLYLTSRVLVGVTKRLWEHIHHGSKGNHQHNTAASTSSLLQHPKTYPIFAAIVWGLVMILFEDSPHVLHKSLKASMDEIYRYQISNVSSFGGGQSELNNDNSSADYVDNVDSNMSDGNKGNIDATI